MYRFGPHMTADDPSVYRHASELDAWKEMDPIPRFEHSLREKGLLDDELDAEIQADIDAQVANAIEEAEAYEPNPSEIFSHVYEQPTPPLRDQQEYLEELREIYGADRLTE